MDKFQAIQIVERLADGLHPVTGQPLPDDSAYNAPDVIRALNLAARTLRASHRSQRALRAAPNAGKPWDDVDEQRLLAQFDRGIPIIALAKLLGRTQVAIRARLAKHGKIEP